jgi:GT2 family glycosyltransferase
MSVPLPINFSIIIPVKRDDPFIERCLSAVLGACQQACDVIVVLDGWNTDRLDVFKEKGPVRVFSLDAAGPAACRHFGATQASHDWLCFIDADVIVPWDALRRSAQHLEASGDDGLIGSYDRQPEAVSTVSRFRNLLHHYHHQRNHGTTGVFWGAFGILRRSAYFAVGGFDPAYRTASVEDIELGYRLAEKGYVVSIRSDVQVCHLKEWTLGNMIRTDILLRAKPWSLLMHKYHRWKDRPLNISSREQLSAILACLTPLMISGLLLTKWTLLPGILSLLIFYIIQIDFYRFAWQHFSPIRMPKIVALHHIYFCSAVMGWMLAFVARASAQKQLKHG